jgi:hypothetical protein
LTFGSLIETLDPAYRPDHRGLKQARPPVARGQQTARATSVESCFTTRCTTASGDGQIIAPILGRARSDFGAHGERKAEGDL